MNSHPIKSAIACLQVVPALETGGAERTTIDVAAALVAGGGKAFVASRGGRMVAELEAAGGHHVDLPVHSKNPVVMALNVERLVSVIKRHQIDIVHARSRAPAWSALAAARRTNLPFVTTYHAKVHERPRAKVFYNSVLARGDAVIANSAYTAERIRQIHRPDEKKLFTIPRGVNIHRLAPGAQDAGAVAALRTSWDPRLGGPNPPCCFLLPARLTRWKGQQLAIDAARRLKEAGSAPFVLVLLGDAQGRDAYVEELTRAIAAHGLGGDVHLGGHCDDMATAYAAADIVLAPSIEPEPFGRVAAEAQAAARPVIVSDTGGGKETVIADGDGRTGWRVPAGDGAALAEAMAAALNLSAADRAAMGARGEDNAAENFSLERMCAATLDVYARLLGKN